MMRLSGLLQRMEEWSARAALIRTGIRKPQTEEQFREVVSELRRLFAGGLRREAVLDRLRNLLAQDVRWIVALNGGGSMRPILEDLFAITGGCTAEEIVSVFPVALVDEWAARQPVGCNARSRLASVCARQAKAAADENQSLLAANLSSDRDERKRWIEDAIAASGASASLGAIESPLPYDFRATGRSEQGPRVTVLLNAFNSASTVRRAAVSILNQTWRNIELIITDDASADETGSLIRALAQEDTRIKVRQNDRNVGTYVSRNGALSLASGQYITCHDADDIAHPERIAAQMQALAATSDAACNISNWIRIGRDGRVRPITLSSFVQENFSSLLIRREVFDAIGYWDSVRTSADCEFRDRIKRRLGKRSEKKLPQIFALGQFCTSTLTGNAETESSWLQFSAPRMRYRRAYKAWHKSAYAEELYMPYPAERRPFDIPA